MRYLGYLFIQLWVRVGLFCYYRKIKVVGLENVPSRKPVMLLSNHQNALMDVLLIATQYKKRPWFVTRSDVFRGTFLKSLFGFLQMLPIYRMRDGKTNLHKNHAVFDQCGKLLNKNEAILLFPEANHNLQRRVRPLNKGFTRIILNALEKNPKLDLQLIPIGQNYICPTQMGDSAALHFGSPIAVQNFIGSPNFVVEIKQKVSESLQQLTTHIPESEYQSVSGKFVGLEELFLKPEHVNAIIADRTYPDTLTHKISPVRRISRFFFYVWNLPLVFLWRVFLKPRVPELEFEATFRFGFTLLAYPLFYLVSMAILWNVYDIKTACLFVVGHAVINIFLVKQGITSSVRKR
ncbi:MULTISPECIES: 1-acyl-sn-glycerol-3-phosphate acyltransferase [Flavobacteriaceae]|uniref:1-acyl-sn-glycerol-3-phosphate acyltransferase n=1 Tax=Flavobacteriaceae TaxID=49546 RepID=UPI0014925B79|nr:MULTISPECIES: 1-acyl-sn-glycerol-3-phosphate acyltransferase [Allomuricauda]MDC6367405.1 1-acyl-sn-glycerol-3-phosphate acyltransferase [Muricauda sp. AC10]